MCVCIAFQLRSECKQTINLEKWSNILPSAKRDFKSIYYAMRALAVL